MAGLGGTLGFHRVSAKAAAFEEGLRSGAMSDDALRDATAGLRAAFAADVANPAPEPGHTAPLLRVTAPMTVLLVEDEPVQRAIMSAQLRALGHTAVAVASGEAALETVRNARPDVILLDIELPGMTGYAVCHALKADPLLAAIPVAFLSARGSVIDRVTGLSMGADEFLTKPLDPRELELRLMHLDRR